MSDKFDDAKRIRALQTKIAKNVKYCKNKDE